MDEEEKQWLKINSAKLRNETDKFIVGEILGGWNDLAAPMLGNQKFYMDLILNPKMVHALFEKLNYVWMRRVDEVMEPILFNICLYLFASLTTWTTGSGLLVDNF